MKPTSFAFMLRTLRKERKLRQSDVAAATDIPARRISYYENEHAVPNSEELIRFARFFNRSVDQLGILPLKLRRGRSGHTPLPPGYLKQFGRAPARYRAPRDVSMHARLHTALQRGLVEEELVARLLSEPGFAALAREAECDSADESVFWLTAADQGAQFLRVSHARVGWTSCSIVRPGSSECLCSRPWPALYVTSPVAMVFFPQVRVRTPGGLFRLDANVAITVAPGQSEFFGLEINGDGHDQRSDKERAIRLKMPVVYLTLEDLKTDDLAGLIYQRYLGARAA